MAPGGTGARFSARQKSMPDFAYLSMYFLKPYYYSTSGAFSPQRFFLLHRMERRLQSHPEVGGGGDPHSLGGRPGVKSIVWLPGAEWGASRSNGRGTWKRQILGDVWLPHSEQAGFSLLVRLIG